MIRSEVFNVDCLAAMKTIPDNYFDLSIIDPPYGIGESSKNRNGVSKKIDKRNGKVFFVKIANELKAWDNNFPEKEYFIELKRISKNQIIFGANHFIENIPNSNSSSWIVWDKCNGKNDFADCELAYTSFKGAIRIFRYMWAGMFKGKSSFTEGHIFEGNISLHEKRIHKTQKPVILYDWIFKNYATEGMKILDTHLGSQSSRISAYKYKMDFTGYELDKDYFDQGCKRFEDFKSQLTLF
jgi:site-specific DNA-methyltransferase (adenine-specific)